MDYREAKPDAWFSDIVERFWSLEYQGGNNAEPEPVLPDGCPEIVFNFADRFQRIHGGEVETQSTAIVSGQIRRRILIRSTGKVSLFGVRFHSHAGYDFLSTPMRQLTDHVLPLSSVIGSHAVEIESRLFEAGSFEERVAIFESQLIGKYSSINGESSLAASLIQLVKGDHGGISIRDLADRSGIGERRIERIFDKYVGVSPKTFARIARFSGVVRAIEAANSFDLLDTALSFGYYDQSHMIRDFNEFAGASPLQYFESTHTLSEFFTGLSDLI